MAYDFKTQSIEDLIEGIQGLASIATQREVQAVAALGARLTTDLSAELGRLSETVFTAKKQLVERLDGLTHEIGSAQAEIGKASTQGSEQTAALVKWTRVLVVVTGVYTAITFGILVVTLLRKS